MVFKVLVFTYILVSVSAGVLPAEQIPVQYSLAAPAVALDTRAHGGEYNDQHGEANYEFSYSVHDAHTGDIKEHHETRHGDNVQGQYSLVEPDGHRRIVDYTADAHSGFNAHVRREEYNHVSPIAAATHGASSNPLVHHAAPVVIKSHAVPIQHTASPIAVAHQIAPVVNTHESPAIHTFVPTTLGQHAIPVGFSHSPQQPLAVAHHSAPLTVDFHDAHLSGHHASDHSNYDH